MRKKFTTNEHKFSILLLSVYLLFLLLPGNKIFAGISEKVVTTHNTTNETHNIGEITNKGITNISFKEINTPSLPNIYLKTGKLPTTNTVKESLLRRFDIVFFISMPITFYFTQNLLMIKNQIFFGMGYGVLTDMDWNYIYLNTFIIPFIVAFKDYLYVKKHSIKTDRYESLIFVPNLTGINLTYTYKF